MPRAPLFKAGAASVVRCFPGARFERVWRPRPSLHASPQLFISSCVFCLLPASSSVGQSGGGNAMPAVSRGAFQQEKQLPPTLHGA